MSRPKANCALCPFAGKTQIHSQIPTAPDPKILILGEAPGEVEESQQKPFVGPSGKILDWALNQVGLYRPALWITNTIFCRPPQNDIGSIDASDAIDACRPALLAELTSAYDAGVRTIIALGLTAAKALKISGKMADIRGSVYQFQLPEPQKVFNVIPTYHPSNILRQKWKRSGGGTADDTVLWLADLRKAKTISIEGFSKPPENFNLSPELYQVQSFCRNAIQNKKTIAVDTETTGLSFDYARIVVIGLATSASDALSVPILTTDGRPYWSSSDWPKVFSALNELFSSCDQIYQNCFFDVPMLHKAGFTLPPERIVYDTLLLHHTIAPESPHDLGTIVSLYGKTPFWKSIFRDRDQSILSMDQIEMRRYNLRDCVVLHQVIPAMLRDLTELHLEPLWNTEVRPLIPVVLELTETGIGFDQSALKSFTTRLKAQTTDLEKSLKNLMSLPEAFNLDSDDHLRYFLFGHEPTSFKHLAELPSKKPGTKIYSQLQALQDLQLHAKPFYIIPGWDPPKLSTSGKPAVDKDGLLSLQIQLNNRYNLIKDQTERAQIAQLQEFLKGLSEYSRLSKLLTTYTKYKPAKDGRIYARWLMHGTVSGRLSCQNPNLQQVPKPKDDSLSSEVRNLFVARPGWKFISADYVNLEAQLLAFETLDPILCSVFEKGLNLHDLNTRSMFHIEPDDPKWKAARKAAKVFFFGGISYGGGDQTIYRKVYLEAPELGLTFAEFKKAKDSWMAEHPAYVRWKAEIIRKVAVDRELRTEFGRLRQFFGNVEDIGKEGLDFMIQSAGASLVNRASARIYSRLKSSGSQARFVLQIHDQLVLEAPEPEVGLVKSIMVEELERPFVYKGITRSIPVDCQIAERFGEVS